MTIVMILVVCTVAFTALFWGVTLVLQGYLYSQPADRLPLRALVCGLAMACFVTFWTHVNTRATHKDKYGTLFEFNPTAVEEVNDFDAVRRLKYGAAKEATVPYRWVPGTDGGEFIETGTGKPFQLNAADFMTIALMVPDSLGNKSRFTAEMDGAQYVREGGSGPVTFREDGGSRTVSTDNLHHMLVPSSRAFVLAVMLNVVHFLLWVAIWWPGLRFNIGHTLALTALFGLSTMLVLMPLLFNLNAPK